MSRHAKLLFLLPVLLVGCYSFRGGSVPPHLKTVGIPPVDDVSGYGDGRIRQTLTERLVARFRDDNSLRVVSPTSGDARLEVTVSSVRDDIRLGVSSGEYETDRQVVIEARATLVDNVKRRDMYSGRTFRGTSQYAVSRGADGKRDAIDDAIRKLVDEILLASVADW